MDDAEKRYRAKPETRVLRRLENKRYFAKHREKINAKNRAKRKAKKKMKLKLRARLIELFNKGLRG